MKYYKKNLILMLFVFAFQVNIFAGQHIGIGTHIGIQYDVGLLEKTSYDTLSPQINYITGISIKSDYKYLFLQVGIDKSFPIVKSEIAGTTTKLIKSNIQYISTPVYSGINFPIRDRGKFFLGLGGAYILGSGTLTTTDGITNFNSVNTVYGFITGIQISVSYSLDFIMEWEYIQGSSDPVVNTDIGKTWKNFQINYSGNRFYLGIRYYAI